MKADNMVKGIQRNRYGVHVLRVERIADSVGKKKGEWPKTEHCHTKMEESGIVWLGQLSNSCKANFLQN